MSIYCCFFARPLRSTSEFAKIVLSKCVIHAGFVTVAPDLWIYNFQPSTSVKSSETLGHFSSSHSSVVVLKQLAAVWTFTFSMFNLVIRLSNVKQSAIFPLLTRRSLCWNSLPQFGHSPFLAWGFGFRTCFRCGIFLLMVSSTVRMCT